MEQEQGNKGVYPESGGDEVKVPRRRISVWAGSSIIVGLVAIFIHYYPLWIWALGLVGFASGFFAIWQISRSKGLVRGYRYAIVGIIISAAFLALTVYRTFNQMNEYEYACRMYCQSNLTSLNNALKVYAKENGQEYPAADDWCDLLINLALAGESRFVCKDSKGHHCSYAINPDCEPDSAGSTVLLFETDGGWNRFGGAELLGIASHKGKGCHILLNNGYVGFLMKENYGSLRWK